MNLTEFLESKDACDEATKWATGKSSQEAWESCERADWMLWIAAKVVSRQQVVLAACACARTALKFVPAGEEDRPRICIEVTEAWARGEATIEQVRASRAAYYADAAAAAYYAAAAANAYAHKKALADMSILVRQHIPWNVISGCLPTEAGVE